MKTGDEWKEHRRLMADTMSFNFLNEVAGPRIYEGTLTLIQLWKEKARLAKGRPFAAAEDIKQGAFEVIWAATFGSKVNASKTQADLLAGVDRLDLPADVECEATIPQASPPETFKALTLLSDSVSIPLNSLFPAPHHKLALTVLPKYRKALAVKNRLIDENLDAAWQKFKSAADDDDAVKSAVDLIVQREVQLANKENRAAMYNSPVIRDELYGYMSAGFDTSSTTLEWAVKFLTDHQEAQKKLRQELHAAFADAKAEGRVPSASELAKTKLPYLAACVEEAHRLGGTVSIIIRSTMQDTELLGRVIPKGTDVFFLNQGPGYTTKAIPVDEKLRSTSSRESKGKNNEWDAQNIEAFLPERWLAKGEDGEVVFDPRAGPDMPFGSGTRGCFGKLDAVRCMTRTLLTFDTGRRLAELELKVIIGLVIWNFNLEPTPAGLSSYAARHDLTRTPRQCYLRLSVAT